MAAKRAVKYGLNLTRLDVKQADIARTLLCDSDVFGIDPAGIPVVLSPIPDVDLQIVLDLDDRPRVDYVAAPDQGRCVYLKLQVHDPSWYRGRQRDDLLLLSMPMLLGGSKVYVMTPDNDPSCLFRNTLLSRPDYGKRMKDVRCSFVGAMTHQDRVDAVRVLRSAFADFSYAIATPGHATADVATLPYQEYIKLSRRSWVCVSLNGQGPFCLKDGELFSNACTVLRQDHPSLHINSLSPQHGKQWYVAATQDLVSAAQTLFDDRVLRTNLAEGGWTYLRDALRNRGFARVYAKAVDEFLTSGTKHSAAGLLLGD